MSDIVNLHRYRLRQALIESRAAIRRPQYGVLVLCDLFGATPCNCACLAQCDKVRVITGCNLAMVLKIFNYAHLDVESLAHKALEGGKDHIFEAHP